MLLKTSPQIFINSKKKSVKSNGFGKQKQTLESDVSMIYQKDYVVNLLKNALGTSSGLVFLIVEWFVFLHNSSITSLPLLLKSSVIRNAGELNYEFSALLRFYGPSRLNFVEHIAVKALLLWLGLVPILLLGWNNLLDWGHKWSDSYDHQNKGQLEEQGSNLCPLRLL